MRTDIYLKIRNIIGDDCKLVIPEHWGKHVLSCLECIEGISSNVKFHSVEEVNGELVMDYDVNEWAGLRSYIEDEIFYTNSDIKKAKGGSMLYSHANDERCKKCGIIVTKTMAIRVGDDPYCRSCGIKLAPPTLIITKHPDGKFFIDGQEQLKPVDTGLLVARCDWFIRYREEYKTGRERLYLEYYGNKKCRYFKDQPELKLPTFWADCITRGICPFS